MSNVTGSTVLAGEREADEHDAMFPRSRTFHAALQLGFRTAALASLAVGSALLAPTARAQTQDYKLAPPPEELDARSDRWMAQRRWMAVLIVGGTVVAGGAGSVIRRRQRKRLRESERQSERESEA